MKPAKKRPARKKRARVSKAELAFARAWRLRCPFLPTPEREYRFHPTRGWRFDFAWPKIKLAVELDGRGKDGGIGAHQSVTGQRRDYEKQNAAVILGWRVLRFPSMDRAKVLRWCDTVREAMRGPT